MKLDYSNLHVVVTGGAGALGAAVVELLIDAGATVHIPAHRAPDTSKFPLARNERVKIAAPVDLADEEAVRTFYQSLPSLWASVHAAGGFAAGAIADTSLDAGFVGRTRRRTNLGECGHSVDHGYADQSNGNAES